MQTSSPINVSEDSEYVSVIVPTMGRVDYLSSLVDSILRQSRYPDEIIVVDGSPGRDAVSHIERIRDKCTRSGIEFVVVKQTRGGLPSARNLGIKYSKGTIVLFLDDDVFLDVGYIAEILRSFSKSRKVCGVTGVAAQSSERNRYRTNPWWRRLREFRQFQRLKHVVDLFFLREHPKEGKLSPSGFMGSTGSGCTEAFLGHNMAFRSKIFSEFRFDECLERVHRVAPNEDVDFTYHVSRKYSLVVNPNARLLHREGPCVPDYYKAHKAFIRNHYYTIRKAPFSLDDQLAFFWSFLGIVLERILVCIVSPRKENLVALEGLVHGLASAFSESGR